MEEYDGIPIADPPIEEVDWLHRGDYIRTRSARKGTGEFEWSRSGRPKRRWTKSGWSH